MAKKYISPVQDYSDDLQFYAKSFLLACGCAVFAIIGWLIFVASTVYIMKNILDS